MTRNDLRFIKLIKSDGHFLTKCDISSRPYDIMIMKKFQTFSNFREHDNQSDRSDRSDPK